MLIKHNINGVVCEVDDEYGEELIATGHFSKPRRSRGTKAPEAEAPEAETTE